MLPEIHTPIPGPRSLAAAAQLRRFESRNVTHTSANYPVFWERAEGVNVWDVDGNRFLDWTSAFGVAGLGHSAPGVRDALVEQAGRLLHGMGDVHPTPLKARLCAALSGLTFERWGAGPGKTILGNSGFEAVEAALKTAFLATGKPGVIAFHGAYHGLGYGALEVAGMPYFREPFRRQLREFATLVPFPKGAPGEAEALAALEQQLEEAVQRDEIGAVLVEPVQGRGGELIPPDGFLPMLRRFCDRHGLLLILDEIYTGFNRTGRLFACEHFAEEARPGHAPGDSPGSVPAVVPDLICLAKGLTGGFPLSACVGRAAVMDAWPPSNGEALHTSTFLGNPLGCAMALASLEEHARPAVAAQVREHGERVLAAFSALRQSAPPGGSPTASPIVEVRGLGLLVGIELRLDGAATNAVVRRALADGLILLQSGPAGNVLSFTPPFAISDGEIAFTAERLAAYLC